MPNSLVESTQKVFDVLEPLPSEDRKKVIQAVMTLLGDVVPDQPKKQLGALGDKTVSENYAGVSAQAQSWLKKNNLSLETLEQYLHIDNGKAEVIELPPGAKSATEKTKACYLMAGLAAFFSTGDASFSDADARELCNHFGCYDQTNHSKYVKQLGNAVTGNKGSGFKLTAPGLTQIAKHLSGAKAGD